MRPGAFAGFAFLASLPSLPRCLLFSFAFAIAGCAQQPVAPVSIPRIETAFSPEAGSETLVVKVISSARKTLRLAGYSFTSPTIVRALMDAKRRGVDVRIVIDDRGNHSAASLAAIRLIANAGIPVRTISIYPVHHDKYIVVDGRDTETGSFNYSRAAAKSNSENVIVIWNDKAVAATYLAHWESRWSKAVEVEMAQ